jgi:hypothetical protein
LLQHCPAKKCDRYSITLKFFSDFYVNGQNWKLRENRDKERTMVEPITTLTAATIATMIATKAFEKTGEKVSESVWTLVSKFLTALRHKDQTTAEAIDAVAQNPALAEQQPQTYGTPALVEKVEAAAQTDAEIQQTAQEIQTAVQAQPGAIVNLTQLAEKIGVVNQGTIVNQTNNFSF